MLTDHIAPSPKRSRDRAQRTPRRTWGIAAASAASLLLLVGCGTTVEGQGHSVLFNANTVGGLPVVDGPTGIRPDSPQPTGDVHYGDGSEADKVAVLSVNDVEEYWKSHYGDPLQGSFEPIANLASYDSTQHGPILCGQDQYGDPNAFFCPRADLMAWDRGQLVPTGIKYFGEPSIAAMVAHEYGHAVQYMAKIVDRFTPVIVREQQADCFAGTYIRWVAEGSSKRFSLNTSDGLNKVLAGIITIRDPILTQDDEQMIEDGHGTALDRISAFQTGFVDGIAACAKIDMDSVEANRGDLPMMLKDNDRDNGEISVDQRIVTSLIDTLNQIFHPKQPPSVSFQAGAPPCADAKTTSPASYCPATNTITVDLAGLQALGRPADTKDHVLVQGDNTAMSVLTSRYMLALQHERGTKIDTAAAALRTACLTGVAQRKMAEPSGQDAPLRLTAGDLDEAVAGLLNNGLAASDVNGNTVAAGFTRIMAFRSGLLNPDTDRCFTRFP